MAEDMISEKFRRRYVDTRSAEGFDQEGSGHLGTRTWSGTLLFLSLGRNALRALHSLLRIRIWGALRWVAVQPGLLQVPTFTTLKSEQWTDCEKCRPTRRQFSFVSEKVDVPSLAEDLKAHGLDGDARMSVAPFGDPVALADAVRAATLVVAYTKDATGTNFIDGAVASSRRSQDCTLRERQDRRSPGKVAAYRWRSMNWEEFARLLE